MLMIKERLLTVWLAYKRLTGLSFPRRFPIVQFPNLPLIVAVLAAEAGKSRRDAGLVQPGDRGARRGPGIQVAAWEAPPAGEAHRGRERDSWPLVTTRRGLPGGAGDEGWT